MTTPSNRKWRVATGMSLMALLYAAPSYAYLDPGTGSILVQSILAGIAVAVGAVRLYWYRIKAFFTGAPTSQDGEQELERDSDAQSEA